MGGTRWMLPPGRRPACYGPHVDAECGQPHHGGAASLDGMPDRPVVAVLHNLQRPFLGHAGPALRGGRGCASTSASCAPATRCPRSARSTGSWRSAASRPRSTPRWSRRRRCCARRRSAACRCSACASAPSCSPTRSAARSGGCARRHLDWLALRPAPRGRGRPGPRRAPAGRRGDPLERGRLRAPGGAVELLALAGGLRRGLPRRRALVGRAVPPRARRGRARALVRGVAGTRSARRGWPRRTRAPPTASTCPASGRSRRRSSAASGASSPARAGRVCGHGRADLSRRRHRHRIRDLRRPRAARAAARDGPRDADDRLARGLLRRARGPRLPRHPLRQPRRRPLDRDARPAGADAPPARAALQEGRRLHALGHGGRRRRAARPPRHRARARRRRLDGRDDRPDDRDRAPRPRALAVLDHVQHGRPLVGPAEARHLPRPARHAPEGPRQVHRARR